jgi:hypothetical protein
MTKKKLGAPDHFTGLKHTFLDTRATLYQEALDSKAVGAFYSKVTLDFIRTFGPEEPFHTEPLLDSNGEAEVPLSSTLMLDEREELYAKLRIVS